MHEKDSHERPAYAIATKSFQVSRNYYPFTLFSTSYIYYKYIKDKKKKIPDRSSTVCVNLAS